MLAGFDRYQFQLSGPDQLTVLKIHQDNVRAIVEAKLQQQLAQQYFMPATDLKITLDERFKEIEKPEFDFATLIIDSATQSELALGRQTVSAVVLNQSGQSHSVKIPVSIAMIRDLVVAKANISRGETLNADNIETVRRPVTSRHVSFASFEQAVGRQVQSDIQQYALIKSNVVKKTSSLPRFAIKRNSLVNVIVRRGALTVVLKDAKALDDGNPGDQITLLNSKTKERILAQVVDSTTAEIRY